MYCQRCGGANAPQAAFCNSCGAPLGTAPMPPPPPPPGPYGMPGPGPYGMPPPPPMYMAPRTSGMAIAGFVLSFFCGLLGLIFSIMGYNECKRSKSFLSANGQPQIVNGEGLAIAGICISIASMLIGIFIALAQN